MGFLLGVFIFFVIVKHPVVSVLAFGGLVLLACLPEGGSCSSASGFYSSGYADSDDGSSVPWYQEKGSIWNPEYYENGESRYKTASGYQYSNGTSSYVNEITGIEYRKDGTEARQVWYSDDVKELYDTDTGEYLGTEMENDWGISRY